MNENPLLKNSSDRSIKFKPINTNRKQERGDGGDVGANATLQYRINNSVTRTKKYKSSIWNFLIECYR